MGGGDTCNAQVGPTSSFIKSHNKIDELRNYHTAKLSGFKFDFFINEF